MAFIIIIAWFDFIPTYQYISEKVVVFTNTFYEVYLDYIQKQSFLNFCLVYGYKRFANIHCFLCLTVALPIHFLTNSETFLHLLISYVFLVDCLLWKTFKMVKISITGRVFMYTKIPSVTIQGNICDEVSKWRHSIGSSSSSSSSSSNPCQFRYDVGTGLRIMSRG